MTEESYRALMHGLVYDFARERLPRSGCDFRAGHLPGFFFWVASITVNVARVARDCQGGVWMLCIRARGLARRLTIYPQRSFDRQDHRARIYRTRDEIIFGIEGGSIVVQRMNEDPAETDLTMDAEGAQDSITKQTAADALPPIFQVNSKPPDNDYGNRLRKISSRLGRREGLAHDAARMQRIIADDPVAIGDDKRSRRPPVGLVRLPAQPIVKNRLSGLE
ncbi:MAG: hypothetical protein WA459_22980 [Stellaceae bacterium]